MLSVLAALCLVADPIPSGTSQLVVDVGVPLTVFAYRPATYKGDRLIVVFHGVNRNADEYRDNARAMGERFGALVVAPLFDSERFPSAKYQFGGILTRDRQAAPREEWTYALIPKLVDAVRSREARPAMPFYLIGHSAGGQFLVRMAGFFDSGAARIIAANPGSDLFPTRDAPFGYGFGNLPESLSSDEAIRAYLAKPLTLYLGTGDNVPDDNFDSSVEAMKQGAGRHQRGVACFEAAKRLAAERGWPFGWTLVEARMIKHDHKAMFDHPVCEVAMFGRYGAIGRGD